jgi:hypothetical protein
LWGSEVSAITDRQWDAAPDELWAVAPPLGKVGDARLTIFATKRAAVEFAKKEAQGNNKDFPVLRIQRAGIAVPIEAQFIDAELNGEKP